MMSLPQNTECQNADRESQSGSSVAAAYSSYSSPMSSPLRLMNNLIQYKTVLDSMHDKQQERARSMRPFSSPIRDENEHRSNAGPLSSPISRRSSSYHHAGMGDINGHSSAINQKNKHNKLRQVRDQYRQNKADLRREKTMDVQYKDDLTKQYNQQFNTEGLDVDLDRLIEEERRDDEDEYVEDYEKDLEYYEIQEELEIAEMLRDLEL